MSVQRGTPNTPPQWVIVLNRHRMNAPIDALMT